MAGLVHYNTPTRDRLGDGTGRARLRAPLLCHDIGRPPESSFTRR